MNLNFEEVGFKAVCEIFRAHSIIDREQMLVPTSSLIENVTLANYGEITNKLSLDSLLMSVLCATNNPTGQRTFMILNKQQLPRDGLIIKQTYDNYHLDDN